jgi:transposase InsO family protein
VHHHWHTDIAYIKINHNFYFLIMMLDGYSRYLLGWELMSDMLGSSVENFVQRIKDKYPDARPMLITDNGSQFISIDFKRLVSALQIDHVKTRRNHPQTNGKIERMNGTVKNEAIRPRCPDSFQEACDILGNYETYYNTKRLHAGIRYLRPIDMFDGNDKKILNERGEKIKLAREARVKKNRTIKQTS